MAGNGASGEAVTTEVVGQAGEVGSSEVLVGVAVSALAGGGSGGHGCASDGGGRGSVFGSGGGFGVHGGRGGGRGGSRN